MMKDAFSEFLSIPGLGRSTSQDLLDMGYESVEQLKNSTPEQLYDELCSLKRYEIDKSMLYVFRCALYYITNSSHEPELLKWWNHRDAL